MAAGDVYELIDRQTLQGQQCLNVYFYQTTVAGDDYRATDLIDEFLADVMPDIRTIQTADVLHIEISARNLFDPTDREDRAISLAGTGAYSDVQNNFSAIGFSLTQDNGAVKNGAKRYAGVPDENVTDGVIVSAGYITYLNTLATQLFQTLAVGAVDAFAPVIVKRILNLAGDYVLPDVVGDLVVGFITDAVFNPLVTSQTSRKVGRGI